MFQIKVSELLSATAKAVVKFCAPSLPELWTLISKQIGSGEIVLKRQSVVLATTLLQQHRLPLNVNVSLTFKTLRIDLRLKFLWLIRIGLKISTNSAEVLD